MDRIPWQGKRTNQSRLYDVKKLSSISRDLRESPARESSGRLRRSRWPGALESEYHSLDTTQVTHLVYSRISMHYARHMLY